jgi:hypothetical protein
LDRVQRNLSDHGLDAEEILAHSKYNTITTIETCQQEGITAFMQNPSGYKREREGFTFDNQTNTYTCSQGAILAFKREQPCREYINY